MTLAYDRLGNDLMTELFYSFNVKFGQNGLFQVVKERASYEKIERKYQTLFFLEEDFIGPVDIIEYKKYMRGCAFIFSKPYDVPLEILIVLMLEMGIDEIPLYLNSLMPLASFISKWRLKVGQ